ncbi:hypothetical protein RIF29_22191 [Crotalaria pallida]|uniref:G-patch domain-containing protein n=1 Tax=Crotalaria pallida TaxID=3830 RepID=A0AAN9F6Q0_CROPI
MQYQSYEGAFNTFVDEINGIAAYQWWEGAIHSILSVVGYPLACSWPQCRRRLKLQRLREFVRSEYDHACLRSCRSRALYEGIKLLKKHGWKEGTGLGISEQNFLFVSKEENAATKVIDFGLSDFVRPEVLDEEDEKLTSMKEELGDEAYEAVVIW